MPKLSASRQDPSAATKSSSDVRLLLSTTKGLSTLHAGQAFGCGGTLPDALYAPQVRFSRKAKAFASHSRLSPVAAANPVSSRQLAALTRVTWPFRP